MRLLSLFFISILFVSCASRKAGWEKETQTVQMSASELKGLKKDALSLWAKRVSTEKLRVALSLFEKIHAASPSDLETLIYLTRGYYFLADSHTDEASLKKQTYEKATSFGEKALALNKDFKQKVSAGNSVEDSLDTLSAKEVPAIYWTAASLGKWAKSSGIAAQLRYKTRIKAMVSAVEKLQPDYFYGAVPRYWGGYYSVAPSFAGGDMNKSKKYFDKSLKIAPEYLGTKVLMAEVYWTKKGNKKAFESMLQEVLKSKHDKHSKLGPENTWEKKKAQKLLDKKDELF